MQVINHGSVHHAGFLAERAIYALSHDEVFSIHPATDPDDEQTREPEPVQFGDLRQPLGCEYIAQLCGGSQGAFIAAGSTTYADLFPIDFFLIFIFIYCYSTFIFRSPVSTLYHIRSPFRTIILTLAETTNWISSHSYQTHPGASTKTTYGVSPADTERRSSAPFTSTKRYACVSILHLFNQQTYELIKQSQSIFTCGEDGFVRVWKQGEGAGLSSGSGQEKKPKEKRGKEKGRFRPY